MRRLAMLNGEFGLLHLLRDVPYQPDSGNSAYISDGLLLADLRQPSPQFARRRPDTQVARDQSRLLKFDSHLDGPLMAGSTRRRRSYKAASGQSNMIFRDSVQEPAGTAAPGQEWTDDLSAEQLFERPLHFETCHAAYANNSAISDGQSTALRCWERQQSGSRDRAVPGQEQQPGGNHVLGLPDHCYQQPFRMEQHILLELNS